MYARGVVLTLAVVCVQLLVLAGVLLHNYNASCETCEEDTAAEEAAAVSRRPSPPPPPPPPPLPSPPASHGPLVSAAASTPSPTGGSTSGGGSTTLSSPPSELLHSRQWEVLDRGLVAVRTEQGVFVSWRLLRTDPASTVFDLYRGKRKLNRGANSTGCTNYWDKEGPTAW
jgi:hypothetical protein